MFDGEVFGEQIVEIVKGYVDRVVEPLLARNVQLEARLAEMEARAPVLSDQQRDDIIGAVSRAIPVARDGKDADPEIVRALIDEAIAAIPPARDGKDADPDVVRALVREAVAGIPPARDGKDADPAMIADLVHAEVSRAIEALPVPKDGRDARIEDAAPMIEAAVKRAIMAIPPAKDGVGLAGALIDRHGSLVVTLSDGSTRDLGPVIGKDADLDLVGRWIEERFAALPTPRDGRDGLGFDDLSIEAEGERGLVLRFARGDNVKLFPMRFPVVLDRGVYKAEQPYEHGDAVTWGGSLWIAQRDTQAKPGEGDDWRLAVKRGRDGRDAKA